MQAIRAALVAVLTLVVASVAASMATRHGVHVVSVGGDLTLVERLALAASNWYVRLLPVVTLATVGGAAILAGVRGAPASNASVRGERVAWMILAAVAVASGYTLLFALNRGLSVWWSLGVTLLAGLFVVSCLGVLVATIRLHRFRRALSTA